MFDFSWSEILLIGVVALVVIGPKDLPRVLRTAGQWMSRARGVAREFQVQVDQLVRESELDDVRKHMSDAASLDPRRMIRNWIDPSGDIERGFTEPELFGETPIPPPEPPPAVNLDEPELPLSLPPPSAPAQAAPDPIMTSLEPREPALEATPVTPDAAPAEVKSGTHG
jgi:sec-independent protein translocase protein TatB